MAAVSVFETNKKSMTFSSSFISGESQVSLLIGQFKSDARQVSFDRTTMPYLHEGEPIKGFQNIPFFYSCGPCQSIHWPALSLQGILSL